MKTYDIPISKLPLVSVDLEASGAYPIGDEICEIGIVRYENGEIVKEYQSLVKPEREIPERTIKIHGITNEMVKDSPKISDIIVDCHDIIKDAVFVAHHAPFDLGFMTYEFEKAGLDLPNLPALCSSLLSRKLFPESKNHRLQTLIHFFELNQGVAHRALDDAIACLEVTKRCIKKMKNPSLDELITAQTKKLNWGLYSIDQLRKKDHLSVLIEAIENRERVKIDYKKGNGISPGRKLKPVGIVRNPDGDYLLAHCLRDKKDKRFYINKIMQTYEFTDHDSLDLD